MRIGLVALCLLALVGLPRVGCGLPLTEYRAGPGPGDTLELFVSGSSAQDSTLQRLFRLICMPGSLDVYRVDGARLFFCNLRGGAEGLSGFAAGQKVAFHKSSVGGSGGGVGPLIQRTPVNFLNVADLRSQQEQRCPASRREVHAAEGALIAYTEYGCSNPNPDAHIPDAGISDVEPQFFLDAYHLAPNAVDVLSVHNANAFIFGIPVSLNLRDALQSAHFSQRDVCHPNNPHHADLVEGNGGLRVKRGESEACMPSLSRAQLSGMFAGTLADWSEIVTARGVPLASRDPNTRQMFAPAGVTAPSDDRVYVCRRVATSGTQAAYEMFFLNRRCTAGVTPFITSGDNVFEGSVTSDVQSCLSQLSDRNVWAVGILTTESVEAIGKDKWRFIKMDGVAPTLLNTFNGRWPFFVEQSYQWRAEQSELPLRGPKLALMSQIGLRLGNPGIIRDLNHGFRHAWGSAGAMALSDPGVNAPPMPRPGHPVDAGMLYDNPVLAVRHDTHNCSAILAQFPTELP
jgi:hypothetical protein